MDIYAFVTVYLNITFEQEYSVKGNNIKSTMNVYIVIEYKTSNIPICFPVVVLITSVELSKQRFFVPLRKQEIEISTLFVGYFSTIMLKKLLSMQTPVVCQQKMMRVKTLKYYWYYYHYCENIDII